MAGRAVQAPFGLSGLEGTQNLIFITYYDTYHYGTTIMGNPNGSASFKLPDDYTAAMTCSNFIVNGNTHFNNDVVWPNITPKDDNYWIWAPLCHVSQAHTFKIFTLQVL